MIYLFVILLNFVLFVYIKFRLEKKFQNTYSIFLIDKEGNRQRLSDTIGYLLERDQIHEKRVLYLTDEMAKQWDAVELMKDNLNTEEKPNGFY
jgi:hypothetical protein|tara:strand:+ start:2755 stop:3033 length:279 start_codon:yes stop_codon:yes gene_type:complete